MGTLKALVGLAILAGLIFVAISILPPYFSNYQWRDDMQTEARFASLGTKSEEAIRESVFKKALEYEIPVKPEQIKVRRDGTDVVISCDYSVVVSFPTGHKVTLDFTNNTEKNRKVQ
jgi:hypothetical protein